ncbi:MAG: nuclear transport factor 2 family protein [Bacteroidota bacterium]
MKSLFLIMSVFFASNSNLDTVEKDADMNAVIEAVEQFVESADQRNVEQMDVIMHSNFRAIVNRLFGSEEVSIMDKALYLDLLKQGKIGGDDRTITIESIHFEGNNALVKASFEGKELVFHTFMQLVRETSGDWKIISDMPNIEKK